jgi:hypothetical protein
MNLMQKEHYSWQIFGNTLPEHWIFFPFSLSPRRALLRIEHHEKTPFPADR